MKTSKTCWSLLLLLLLPACQHLSPTVPVEQCLESVAGDSRQAVVVSAKKSAALPAVAIALYERTGAGWRAVGKSVDGVAGRNGLAPPGEKREGDGRTPSGAFALERAFGYEPIETKMPYIVVDDGAVWIDDPGSPGYNTLATRAEAGSASYEVMKRKDDLYKYGIVIEYNTKEIIPGAGSAIFFHIWRGGATSTAGCIATSEEDMLRLLHWLDPSMKPVTVIGMCPSNE